MQKFPKFFHPSVLAPPHGVTAIYSGIMVYYVRIDNHELTLGWYDIVADHKFGGDYTILLPSVGHLLFDLASHRTMEIEDQLLGLGTLIIIANKILNLAVLQAFERTEMK